MPSRLHPYSLVLFLAAAQYVFSQAAEPNRLNVWISGGLLGHIGGFCEDQQSQQQVISRNKAGFSQSSAPFKTAKGAAVCPPSQTSLGGVLALRDSWARPEAAGVYKLLSGNNLPKSLDLYAPDQIPAAVARVNRQFEAKQSQISQVDSRRDHQFTFLDQLARLHADVIALGQDDLLRTMLPALDETKPADIFKAAREFLRLNRTRVPFLASNAFLRNIKKGTNQIHSHGYELQVDPNQTIPWSTTDFSVRTPLSADPNQQYRVDVCSAAGTAKGSNILGASNGVIKFSVDYLPSVTCAISLSIVGKGPTGISFTVSADLPVTPFSNGTGPASLNNAPAALLTSHGNTPVFVVSLIDPAALTLLESERWKMTEPDGSTTQLVLDAPDQTTKVLFNRLGGGPAVPVLMSDLSDSLTLKTLRGNSRWRIVTVNPDTSLLGCNSGTSGCGKGRTSPYALGSLAVLDRAGNHAQVWARPEWIGETTLKIGALTTGADEWTRVSATEEMVGDPYGPVRTAEKPWSSFIWWKVGGGSDAIVHPLMEAMRHATSSEISIADKSMIDADAADEVAREFQAGLITGLGPQQFFEIFWRHDAYIKVGLTGTDLVALLGKIAALPVDDDGGYCVLGPRIGADDMECSIPKTIDIGTMRINGRFADPNMAYSVAIPQSMAQRLDLGDFKKARTDVLKGYRDFLLAGGICGIAVCPVPAPPGQTLTSVPPAWINRHEKKWMKMIYIPPAAVEIGGQDYRVPLQVDGKTPDTSGFALIPNVYEKVTHTFKFNMVGEIHLVPVDLPYLTLDFVSRANLNRLDTYATTEYGVKQIAYSPDLWVNGVSLRSRFLSDEATRILRKIRGPETLRIEPFIGLFDESSIFHYDNKFQSTAADANGKPLYTLEEQDRKPNFLYASAGIGFGDLPLAKFLTAKKTLYQFDYGRNFATPESLMIGSRAVPYTLDQVRRCGIQKLIDKPVDDKDCPGAGLTDTSPLVIRYNYGEQHLNRHQIATSLEFAFGSGASKKTITLGLKGYSWQASNMGKSPLDPRYSGEVNITAAVPFIKGITVGPYLRYFLVKTDSAGTFMSDRYGFTFNFPFISKAGAGKTIY